jgi:hypothetical protein
MTIKIIQRADAVSPAIKAKLQRAKNPRAVLEAFGVVVISLAKRSFSTPFLRPSTWASLKPATIKAKRKAGLSEKPLQATTTLAKSSRIIAVTTRSVTIGSDRRVRGHSLAAIHQLGTPKAGISPRPFFPFDADGRPTNRARSNILTATDAALKLGQK